MNWKSYLKHKLLGPIFVRDSDSVDQWQDSGISLRNRCPQVRPMRAVDRTHLEKLCLVQEIFRAEHKALPTLRTQNDLSYSGATAVISTSPRGYSTAAFALLWLYTEQVNLIHAWDYTGAPWWRGPTHCPITTHFFKTHQYETKQFKTSSFSFHFNYACHWNRFSIIQYFNKYKNIKENFKVGFHSTCDESLEEILMGGGNHDLINIPKDCFSCYGEWIQRRELQWWARGPVRRLLN